MTFNQFPVISHPCHFVGLLFAVEDSSAADPVRACGCLGVFKAVFWVAISIFISILAGSL